MKGILRWAVLATLVLTGGAAALSAQEAPKVQISVGTSALNPGDVITLPETSVGDASEPLVLTIANEGDAPLELSAADPPALSGEGEFTFLIDTSETEATIPPGGRTTLGLLFFPSETGKSEATLTVTTNDPEVPSFALTLSGTAVEGED